MKYILLIATFMICCLLYNLYENNDGILSSNTSVPLPSTLHASSGDYVTLKINIDDLIRILERIEEEDFDTIVLDTFLNMRSQLHGRRLTKHNIDIIITELIENTQRHIKQHHLFGIHMNIQGGQIIDGITLDPRNHILLRIKCHACHNNLYRTKRSAVEEGDGGGDEIMLKIKAVRLSNLRTRQGAPGAAMSLILDFPDCPINSNHTDVLEFIQSIVIDMAADPDNDIDEDVIDEFADSLSAGLCDRTESNIPAFCKKFIKVSSSPKEQGGFGTPFIEYRQPFNKYIKDFCIG